MRIGTLTRKTYKATTPYTSVSSVEDILTKNSFLVVMEKDDYYGILTPADVIKSSHRLVIDCLRAKSRIDCEQDIDSVLELMKENQDSVLPVFRGVKFIGVVTKEGILNYLFKYGEDLEREIDKRTAELEMTSEKLRQETTMRKQMEEALMESENSYRSLAHSLPGLVYRVFLRKNNRMQFFNNMLHLTTGYRVGELLRGEVCSIEPFIIPEDRTDVVSTVKNAIEEDKPFEVEYRFRRKDGEIRYFFERGRPLYGTDGSPLYIDGIIIDITKRKQAEQALLEREKELKIQTNNLEEANVALKVLLKKRDEDKVELEEKILLNLKELVIPYLEKLKRSRIDERQMAYLSILESNLNDIVLPFSHKLSSKFLNFTPTEIQVANLLRLGKTNKEISELLNSSFRTVAFHRENIRKKLGLTNKKINLKSYLISLV